MDTWRSGGLSNCANPGMDLAYPWTGGVWANETVPTNRGLDVTVRIGGTEGTEAKGGPGRNAIHRVGAEPFRRR